MKIVRTFWKSVLVIGSALGIVLAVFLGIGLKAAISDEPVTEFEHVLAKHNLEHENVEVKDDLSFEYNGEPLKYGVAHEFDIITFDIGDVRQSGVRIKSTHQDYHTVYKNGDKEVAVKDTNLNIHYFDRGSKETSKYVIDGVGGIHVFLQRGTFNQ